MNVAVSKQEHGETKLVISFYQNMCNKRPNCCPCKVVRMSENISLWALGLGVQVCVLLLFFDICHFHSTQDAGRKLKLTNEHEINNVDLFLSLEKKNDHIN